MSLDSQNKAESISVIDKIKIGNFFKKGHILHHPFQYINDVYGTISNFVHDAQSIFTFISSIRNFVTGRNKNIFQVINNAIPAVLNGVYMGTSLKKYMEFTNIEDLVDHSKIFNNKLAAYLQLSDKYRDQNGNYKMVENGCDTSMYNIDFIDWFITSNTLEDFNIIKSFAIEKINDITRDYKSIKSIKDGKIHQFGILFKYEGMRFIIHGEVRGVLGMQFLNSLYIVNENTIKHNKSKKTISDGMMKEFIKGFDVANNTLKISENGLIPEQKIKVREHIYQIDVDEMANEINKILKCNGSRGYSYMGRQGVGKTSVLRKLEEKISSEYPIVTFGVDVWSCPGNLKQAFQKLKLFDKAVLKLEDIESHNIKDKNSIVGAFIDGMDSLGDGFVVIISLNDTTMVHSTIINRAGRIDEHREIKSPQNVKEVKIVVESRFDSIVGKYYNGVKFGDVCKLDDKLYEKIIEQNFTQADIANGIIDKVFILCKSKKSLINKFDVLFEDATNKLIESKESLKKYNFSELEYCSSNIDPVDETKQCYPSLKK